MYNAICIMKYKEDFQICLKVHYHARGMLYFYLLKVILLISPIVVPNMLLIVQLPETSFASVAFQRQLVQLYSDFFMENNLYTTSFTFGDFNDKLYNFTFNATFFR
jgi:hypothetical protein